MRISMARRQVVESTNSALKGAFLPIPAGDSSGSLGLVKTTVLLGFTLAAYNLDRIRQQGQAWAGRQRPSGREAQAEPGPPALGHLDRGHREQPGRRRRSTPVSKPQAGRSARAGFSALGGSSNRRRRGLGCIGQWTEGLNGFGTGVRQKADPIPEHFREHWALPFGNTPQTDRQTDRQRHVHGSV
jgi:hypothetical protein